MVVIYNIDTCYLTGCVSIDDFEINRDFLLMMIVDGRSAHSVWRMKVMIPFYYLVTN